MWFTDECSRKADPGLSADGVSGVVVRVNVVIECWYGFHDNEILWCLVFVCVCVNNLL